MYDHIAYYYDLTHGDLTEDVPFVLKLARQLGGPALELGCGSGRLLLPLAQAGLSVTGLDNSAAMLARARQKLAQADTAVQNRVQLVAGDMTDFALDGRFALTLIPYNTFLHLDGAQALATLRCARNHLQADGRLLIDLANPFAMADTPPDTLLSLENCLTDPATGDTILHFAANRLDTVEQILHITWVYDRSPAGGPVQRVVAQADYHYRYPHQMELLLREAGFPYFSLWGDYEEVPFAEDSARMLVVARTMNENP